MLGDVLAGLHTSGACRLILSDRGQAARSGFEGLEGVQRLYRLDLMALVSYDQVTPVDVNNWSLGYVPIVGAAILKGTRHDVSTLIDLAVVDAPSHSPVLRAGGTDTRQGTTTLIQEDLKSRQAGVDGFTAATAQMLDHFDSALTQFEADVRAGKANVRIVSRGSMVHSSSTGGGGGAFTWGWLLALVPIVAIRKRSAGRFA